MKTLEQSTSEPMFLCSSISYENNEQIFGTATEANVWFILEHPAIYNAKALEESRLPEQVKTYLITAIKMIPDSRLQLVKREYSSYPKEISFFIGLTSEEDPRLYEFKLSEYAELMDLDLVNFLANADAYTKNLRSDPLYLVCTNGKRDPCCLKFGFIFYKSLSHLEQEATWQTSHVGGHRFAANLVCFPHGLFYGRLSESDAPLITRTYRHSDLVLEKYRGRSCYPAPVQAAEFYLRKQTGESEISAFHLEDLKISGENRWKVVFTEVSSRREHRILISGVPSEFEVLKSCRDRGRSQVTQFFLDEYLA